MKRHLILAALLTIGAANLNAASPKKTAPEQKGVETINPVSYTHLTLPTN